MPKPVKNSDRKVLRSVTDRGCSRRFDTAENHLNAVKHYRARSVGRKNKAPKE